MNCQDLPASSCASRRVSPPGGRRTPQAGFSLVELAIVIAIIGVLAAIAAPSFFEMQLRAKRAEADANIDGIDKAMLIALQSHPDFQEHRAALWTSFDYAPRGLNGLDKQAVMWTVPPRGNTTVVPGFRMRTGEDAWKELGFLPDGQVRCTYGFILLGSAATNRLSQAACDLDDDDIVYQHTIMHVKRPTGQEETIDTITPSAQEY